MYFRRTSEIEQIKKMIHKVVLIMFGQASVHYFNQVHLYRALFNSFWLFWLHQL